MFIMEMVLCVVFVSFSLVLEKSLQKLNAFLGQVGKLERERAKELHRIRYVYGLQYVRVAASQKASKDEKTGLRLTNAKQKKKQKARSRTKYSWRTLLREGLEAERLYRARMQAKEKAEARAKEYGEEREMEVEYRCQQVMRQARLRRYFDSLESLPVRDLRAIRIADWKVTVGEQGNRGWRYQLC